MDGTFLTEYYKVKITRYITNSVSEPKVAQFVDAKIVDSIKEAVLGTAGSKVDKEKVELVRPYIYRYEIVLSTGFIRNKVDVNRDTLYYKAYLSRGNNLYEFDLDFARYIEALLRCDKAGSLLDEDADAVNLFASYGWTLDFRINAFCFRLGDFTTLTGFDPNAYYFAFNNALSKDIGLDMTPYAGSVVTVKIYYIHEPFPPDSEPPYQIRDARGIVVKKDGEIIGAYITSNSTLSACSLKGNTFEQATGYTIDKWLAQSVQADAIDKTLASLEPEEVIERYFQALADRDEQVAVHCVSKKAYLSYLTTNMPFDELFNEFVYLPLVYFSPEFELNSYFDYLASIKLHNITFFEEHDANTKYFFIDYDRRLTTDGIETGNFLIMVYESPQTGWKIYSIGNY